MREENIKVLSNIIAAVESGGQVYSETNKNWQAYAGKYANTINEVTCTLGPYQAYGDEAQELIQYIHDKYPDVFKQCDTRGLIEAKLSVSWVGTKWGPSDDQKAVLIRLLGTDAGHEASEHVFRDRLDKYLKCAEAFGVAAVDAQMMWCEVQHLGGLGAAQRVFTRTDGDFTVDNILESLRPKYADLVRYKEPVEHSKFWSRHVKCVEFIKKYAVPEDAPGESEDASGADPEEEEKKTMGVTAEQILDRARHYIGYREKNHKTADLESFKADAGDGNYTKFSGLCGYGIQPWQWCQLFVCGVAVEVCGSIEGAEHLLCDQDLNDGVLTSYTPTGSSYFKQAGRWFTEPEPGDVVYFYSSSMGRICHTGYVEDVDKVKMDFGTIEGNTNSDGFTTNGGCVARHRYSYKHVGGTNRVAGFGRPRYGEIKELTERQKLVATGQRYINEFTDTPITIDGVRGSETTRGMVRCIQRACNLDYDAGLKEDGWPGPITSAALSGHYIEEGEIQWLVTAVEIIMYCLGRDPGGVEFPGHFGEGLAKAANAKHLTDKDILALIS